MGYIMIILGFPSGFQKKFGSLRTVGVGWARVPQQAQHIVGKSLVEAFRCPL